MFVAPWLGTLLTTVAVSWFPKHTQGAHTLLLFHWQLPLHMLTWHAACLFPCLEGVERIETNNGQLTTLCMRKTSDPKF